jgi:hypothetical protein
MNTININRKKLTTDEIEKYKNFKSVLNSYSKFPTKTSIKNPWLKLGLYSTALILTSTLAWFFIIHKAEKGALKEKQTVKSFFINPPMPQCNLPFKSFLYYNTSDTIINISSTSKIEIRKNSLTDSTGKFVNGPIEIRYREFMDPAEIFLSGIPMVYDSAGVKNNFESAGMIEIYANSQGKPLYIVPEKSIKISFQSTKSSSGYNLYNLDTLKKKWIYNGKDNITIQKKSNSNKELKPDRKLSTLNDSLKTIKSAITELELRKPLIPTQANPKKWHFTLDILPKEFPELSVYAKSVFEVDEQYKPLNPKHKTMVWDDILIEKSEKPMHYFVTFRKDTMRCRYLAVPVLNGKDYSMELQNYAMKFSVYQSELSKRRKTEARLQQQLISSKIAQTKNSNNRTYNNWQTEQNVIRSFEVLNFGIWNCDQPLKYANSRIQNPIFMVNDTVYVKTAYLANISENVLITLYPGNELRYNKNAKNILWIVTNNNHVAVFKSDDFSIIPANGSNYTFHFHSIKTPIASSNDFLKLYQSNFDDL